MWKKIRTWVVRTLRILLFSLLLFLSLNFQHVVYGLQQLSGQIGVLYGAITLEEFKKNNTLSKEQEEKIAIIADLKRFSVEKLGLNPSGSYEKIFDQKGKPILWVLTACRPYELQAYKWNFPIAGEFSYKGFFVEERANLEKERLERLGWEVDIGEVNAWSTLGWFNDPILSSFLEMGEGRLAELILHELTHGTLFVKSNINFNENLATFVGEYGAELYLKEKYKGDSSRLLLYSQSKKDRETYVQFVMQFSRRVDSLYKSFGIFETEADKKQKKQELFSRFLVELEALPFLNPEYSKRFAKMQVDNNYLLGFLRYKKDQNSFRKEFEEEFNSDFPKYMNYLKEKYPSLL